MRESQTAVIGSESNQSRDLHPTVCLFLFHAVKRLRTLPHPSPANIRSAISPLPIILLATEDQLNIKAQSLSHALSRRDTEFVALEVGHDLQGRAIEIVVLDLHTAEFS